MNTITVTALRPVEVDLKSLTKDDLELMNKEQLIDVLFGLVELLNDVPTEKEKPVKNHIGGNKDGIGIGIKRGKSSRYHYVDLPLGSHKFRAKVKINGVSYNLGYFADEIDAALAIDEELDRLKDENRPRNRDEFTEVAEAYY